MLNIAGYGRRYTIPRSCNVWFCASYYNVWIVLGVFCQSFIMSFGAAPPSHVSPEITRLLTVYGYCIWKASGRRCLLFVFHLQLPTLMGINSNHGNSILFLFAAICYQFDKKKEKLGSEFSVVKGQFNSWFHYRRVEEIVLDHLWNVSFHIRTSLNVEKAERQ